MKTRTIIISIASIFLFTLTTCKKDPQPIMERFDLSRENLTIGTTMASIEGSYTYSGIIDEIMVCVSENGVHPAEFIADINGKNFTVEMTGLHPATSYQYYYSIDYGFSKPFITETKSFTTYSESPEVKALEWLKIDSTTYRIKCQVVADGGSEVTERGICWNTFGSPILYDDSTKLYTGPVEESGEYAVRMEHLDLGKKYYVRAFAKNAADKTGLSEVMEFQTEAPAGQPVEIELSCNPEQGGTVTGGGTYEIGTQCTATAEANAGYTFINWTENGNQVSSDATYTFPVTISRNLVANFTKQAYVITVEVTPENGGTVTGAGGYDYGEECTLTATPNTGYDFQKWTKGGTTVSTNASFTFPVTETATYKAHFKIKSYTIGVSANPENGGTVEGGGSYDHGQNCTVKATPAEGYAFTNWTDDGEVASEDADYTFTVTSNRTLVANFKELQANEYSIQVSANPTEGGTVTGGGTYTQGTSCTVRATKNTGYRFVNWTENGNHVWDLAEYEFTVEGNRILVANFEAEAPAEYTINVSANPSNGGTVTGGGTYQQGDQCTVEATANEGYTFINWTTENGEEASTSARYTFIVTSDRTLVANFQVQSHTISVSADPSNGGSVSGGGTYNHGESCTVSATANNGYTFTNWTEGGNVVSTNANYTFTVTDDRTLVAHFEVQAPNTYNINVSANPPAGGTVTGGGSYQQGQQCTVTATENEGYTFLRWTENGNQVSPNLSYTFEVTGNRTLVAHFQVRSYTIGVSANPSNGGSVTGGGTYTHGQNCEVTAAPATGYNFIGWTENGNQVSTDLTYSFAVTGNRNLMAQFQLKSYTISVSANPTNGGTVNGGGTYNHGQSCTVTADDNSGYTFLRWTENGTQVSTNASYTFTVTGPRTLVAQFQQQTYTITATANPTNGGTATVSGNGTFTYNQQCTLTATPNSHYSFTNWKKDNNVVSIDAIYTFYVTESASYTANFTQDPQYTITATANPTNGGSVSGGGTYYQGQTCSLTASPANSNYTFANWTEGGTVVSTQANYTFTVNGNRTLVANFNYNGGGNAPTGAINGQFTINSSGGKVYFSEGNLQYKASDNRWQFAPNQYDIIGNGNSNISQNYSGWIDLFGWGTSGNNHGAVCYQPWSTSQTNSDYYAYGNWQYNLYDQSGQADWGYNSIYSGSTATNGWRTLTREEWVYVFQGRSGASSKYGHGKVNGQNGMILLPDEWTLPSGMSFTPGNSSWVNEYTTGQWAQMEQNGAVFLPAAGCRSGISVSNVGSIGGYWSASYLDSNCAYDVVFVGSDLSSQNFNNRYYGQSVRLVRSAQ